MTEKNSDVVLVMGPLRKIVLFKIGAPQHLHDEYQYLFKSPVVKNHFGKHEPVIAGMVNEDYPLLKSSDPGDEAIYIHFSFLEPDTLLRIAENEKKLHLIIDLIRKVWTGKENDIALLKTSENLAMYKQVMKRIEKDNPNSDAGFWDYLAFRELSIHMY